MIAPLQGTIALVTGAAQGVGEAAALRLASDGAFVAANDLRPSERLDSVAKRCAGMTAPGDVADRAAIAEMIERVEAQAGPIDILVANAAVEEMGDFLTQSNEEFWRQVDVNLSGTIALIQAVLPGMRRRGRGRIVLLSSIWGITGYPRAVAYSASKAGLISLTKSLSRELSGVDIAVNAIAPGVIDSPQIEVDARDAGMTLDEMRAFYAARTPLGRCGQPSEFAALISFLSRPDLHAFSGQVLQANGGAQVGWA